MSYSMNKNSDSNPEAAVLQEAIDRIVQKFDYPDSITLETQSETSNRETRVEVQEAGQTDTYVLEYDGSDDANEPCLRPINQ